MITLYNTLTRQKETFEPLEPGKVKMYVCGPTVYNYIHIGNARPAINYDVVRRYLEYKGYEVEYVSNFTDVDDKLIKRSNELNESVQSIADRYIEAFYEDTSALNVKKATSNPRVMNHMDDIIQFIQELVDEGYAYVSGGDVYFRTRKFEDYGKLSHQSLNDLKVGARIEQGEQKEDALDFTLWKQAKPGEISWESPFGEGRPGWHIECSVMATKHLGDTIDIHGGGQDLEFPHHENEIAQSEAKTGHPFANYWMHNGFVTVGETQEKMSKSLGNFVTVHEIIQEIDPQVLRFFMATTQYRRPICYSEKTLQEAENNLQKLKTALENAQFRLDNAKDELANDAIHLDELAKLEDQFVAEMDDDFNAANGITVAYELAKWLNVYANNEEVSKPVLQQAIQQLQGWLAVFGIEFSQELLDDEIEKLIEERNQARKERNFARSDEIRDLLKAQGIILEDTAQGTRWRKG